MVPLRQANLKDHTISSVWSSGREQEIAGTQFDHLCQECSLVRSTLLPQASEPPPELTTTSEEAGRCEGVERNLVVPQCEPTYLTTCNIAQDQEYA